MTRRSTFEKLKFTHGIWLEGTSNTTKKVSCYQRQIAGTLLDNTVQNITQARLETVYASKLKLPQDGANLFNIRSLLECNWVIVKKRRPLCSRIPDRRSWRSFLSCEREGRLTKWDMIVICSRVWDIRICHGLVRRARQQRIGEQSIVIIAHKVREAGHVRPSKPKVSKGVWVAFQIGHCEARSYAPRAVNQSSDGAV